MPASLRTLLTVVAAVLALVGIVGVASGAAKDDGDDVATAGGDTTTTIAGTDLTLGDATTTIPGAATTTIKGGATGTTVKPTGPTTTVATSATDACNEPPAANTNPGAMAAPAVGVYTYVSCTDPGKSQETTVRAGQDGGGKVRREISANFGGFSGTFVTAYGGGVTEEVIRISAAGTQLVCDLNPDVVEYPAMLSVGVTWATKSKCKVKSSFGEAEITYEYSGKVTGRKTVTIGGTAVTTWVVETIQKFGSPQGSGTATSVRYYDPTRGYDLFVRATGKDPDGKEMTESARLASLTPRPL